MDAFYIGLYLLLQIGLGLYLSKFIENESDFFLAGRKLPTYAIAFSIFATWFGAETCIGSSAAVYSKGLAGSKAEPFGYGMCLLLTAIVIAPRVWNSKYTTMGDFIRDKHGELAERLFIWIIIPSSMIWAAAQVKAFGQVLTVTTDLNLFWGITIATAFVIVYTLMGGFLGDVVTDVIQGAILSIGLLLILYFAFSTTGVEIGAIASEKLNFVTPDQSIWQRFDSWMIPILGSLISQELISRVLSAKDKGQAMRSSFGGTFMYLIFGSIPILLGLLGPQFNLQLSDSEQFLPTLAGMVLPKWLFIVFAGALISAILSTIDSILLAASALISHNFVVPVFKIEDQKKKVLIARVTLALAGLSAYLMALFGDSIYEMVETASSFGTTGVLVVALAGMFQHKSHPKLIAATLIIGVLLSVILDIVMEVPAAFTINLLSISAFYVVSTFLVNKFRTPVAA